ncbi:hypothetical protein GCM10011600_12090 [Pseudolysinimonas yzui]|uniref:Mutator family transposase n=1 Tax=Pseudolysinimonas yzui TaxID=2708254 RepID=A0A8J3M3L1_9MICO|nr:hypothetical protein GCM10011600_12090 [Pseudolysinimonas yzui]
MVLRASTAGLHFASTEFPEGLWSQIWSNNPNERLNREIRRRTDSVGIFPNRDAIPEMVRSLVGDALERWAANSWHTFDKTEVNCSGQLFRRLIEARRSDSRFHPLEVKIENILLTPGMLNGTESVAGASRPDLRISVRSGAVLLEAKRLTDTASLSRAYVQDGMARFISSTYGANESWGMMVGYVQDPTTGGLQHRVNGYVNTHKLMGAGHELIQESTNANSEWLSSSHNRASGLTIRLDHMWVVLP